MSANEEQKDAIHSKFVDGLVTRLLHRADNPSKADLYCPYINWMGEDLNHCPGIGEWKCSLQEYWYASDQYGLDSKDYKNCNVNDYLKCELYIHKAENNGNTTKHSY